MNEKRLFQETFSAMHASDHTVQEVLNMMEQGKRGKRFVRRSTAAAFAAACMGTVVLAATAHQWSRGMQHTLQGTTEQMQTLEDKDIAAFPDLSVTDEGVTVTLEQSIVSGSRGYVSLKVSGYDLPKGTAPAFDTAHMEIKEWDGSCGIGSRFDNGLITDGYRALEPDGREPETEEDGSLAVHWQDEDGNLDYLFDIFIFDHEKGDTIPSLTGREVEIDLEGLGFYDDKETCQVEVPGHWHFDFLLPGADEQITYADLEQPVGDTGGILKEVKISPISMGITLEWPRNVISETGYRDEYMTEEDGTAHQEEIPFTYEYYEQPPVPTGIRLKDSGNILWGINQGVSSSGYADEKGDLWVMDFATGKILSPENVSSILFLRPGKMLEESSDAPSEEDCIEVMVQ